jgi:MarR family transcriptional regulator, organic hydroperoxide resistance regulator
VLSENETSSSVLLALQRAAHHTLHALATALAELELTPSELNTMANLADGRPRNVGELSRDTGTRATTLTGVLDRLERRGYLVRELAAADRRSFLVTLTDQGRVIATKVRRAVADIERRALAELSTRELAGYHAVINALQEVS